jgi:hypothetical protein
VGGVERRQSDLVVGGVEEGFDAGEDRGSRGVEPRDDLLALGAAVAEQVAAYPGAGGPGGPTVVEEPGEVEDGLVAGHTGPCSEIGPRSAAEMAMADSTLSAVRLAPGRKSVECELGEVVRLELAQRAAVDDSFLFRRVAVGAGRGPRS